MLSALMQSVARLIASLRSASASSPIARIESFETLTSLKLISAQVCTSTVGNSMDDNPVCSLSIRMSAFLSS